MLVIVIPIAENDCKDWLGMDLFYPTKHTGQISRRAPFLKLWELLKGAVKYHTNSKTFQKKGSKTVIWLPE